MYDELKKGLKIPEFIVRIFKTDTRYAIAFCRLARQNDRSCNQHIAHVLKEYVKENTHENSILTKEDVDE